MSEGDAQTGMLATAWAVHHVGISVADLDAALKFWEAFLGAPARWRARLDRPYLAAIVGIANVSIDAAFLDLPGGVVLELLDYHSAVRRPNPEATPNPGNVHVCLAVRDADVAWARAVECGARPVRPEGPMDIDAGPNIGARGAYMRIHDGVTLELFQPPPNRGDRI